MPNMLVMSSRRNSKACRHIRTFPCWDYFCLKPMLESLDRPPMDGAIVFSQ